MNTNTNKHFIPALPVFLLEISLCVLIIMVLTLIIIV